MGSVAMKRTTLFSVVVTVLWSHASCQTTDTPAKHEVTPNLDCDFEGQTCEWTSRSSESQYKWEKGFGKDRYRETGPDGDHSPSGDYYLLARSKTRMDPNNTALLTSPLVGTSKETCLKFWYSMNGFDVGRLTVSKVSMKGESQELFTKVGPQGMRWYQAAVKSGNGSFSITIEASYYGSLGLGDIAIDDVEFSYDGDCIQDAASQPDFDCSFETSLCGWYNRDRIGRVNYKWSQTRVPPASRKRDALPPTTNGTAIAELKNTRSGSRYNYYLDNYFRGPTMSVGESKACMTFWYKKDGTNVRSFQLSRFKYGEGRYNNGKKVLYSDYASRPAHWKQVKVTLEKGDNFYLTFASTAKGPGAKTYAYLDDITLSHDGPCPEERVESQINCNFDNSFCQWYRTSSYSEGDWVRHNGSTPTNDTGPSVDHTSGDGHYIYLDAAHVENATLYSPSFRVNRTKACLSFWYYMAGRDVATLELNAHISSYASRSENLVTLSGHHGDEWLQYNVTLPTADNLNLIFTANRTYFPRGDIALDDISISFDGPCERDVEPTTTTTVNPMDWIIVNETRVTGNETFVTSTTATTTPTTTTERPTIATPTLRASGKVNPMYNNSRLELFCESDLKDSWTAWYYKRDYRRFFERMYGHGGNPLVIEEAHIEDSGSYACKRYKIRYQESEYSNPIIVNVVRDPRPQPELLVEGFNGQSPVLVDIDIKLMCGVEIDTDGVEYLWETTSDAFKYYWDATPPQNLTKGRVLEINGTNSRYNGKYSCRIRKDGIFLSAKSEELNLEISAGKACTSRYSCYGEGYSEYCRDNRCSCGYNAVTHGQKCEVRPDKPTLYTTPSYLEFGYGETFYIVCAAEEPVPASLTYEFTRDGSVLHADKHIRQTMNVLKISNASRYDSGYYKCRVNHRGIDSFHSDQIQVQVKEFTDLNCDFSNDLCQWTVKNGSGYGNVTMTTPDTETETESNRNRQPKLAPSPDGQYIQLNGEAKYESDVNRAMISSPVIDRTTKDSCLSFWYRMTGANVYSLTVWKRVNSRKYKENEGEKLLTLIGEQSSYWIQKRITVTTGESFHIAFEALGDVSLDDITFAYRKGC